MRTARIDQHRPVGWEPIEADWWWEARAALVAPWPDGAAKMDLRYFASQSALSPDLEMPGYRYFVAVWGWPERRVRKLMASETLWKDQRKAARIPQTPRVAVASQLPPQVSHPPYPDKPASKAGSIAPPKPPAPPQTAAERRTFVAVASHFGRTSERDNAEDSAETSRLRRGSVAVLSDTRDLYPPDHRSQNTEVFSPTPREVATLPGERAESLVPRELIGLLGYRLALKLHQHGIGGIDALCQYSEEEARYIPGVGQPNLRKIVTSLEKQGRTLRDTNPAPTARGGYDHLFETEEPCRQKM